MPVVIESVIDRNRRAIRIASKFVPEAPIRAHGLELYPLADAPFARHRYTPVLEVVDVRNVAAGERISAVAAVVRIHAIGDESRIPRYTEYRHTDLAVPTRVEQSARIHHRVLVRWTFLALHGEIANDIERQV